MRNPGRVGATGGERRSRSSATRGGFTLLEALIALTLSTLIVLLVTGIFLAQNDFYAHVLNRSAAQDAIRTITDYLGEDVRQISPGGLVEAEADGFVARVPVAVGTVCDTRWAGVLAYVHMAATSAELLDEEPDGYALQDGGGSWTYYTGNLSTLLRDSGPGPASRCEATGADTVGARNEFHEVGPVVSVAEGDFMMLYRTLEFRLGQSALDPETRGLFRGPPGGDLVELATGLADSTAFRYRLANGQVRDRVGAGQLDDVAAVLVDVYTSTRLSSVDVDPTEAAWTAELPLLNTR